MTIILGRKPGGSGGGGAPSGPAGGSLAGTYPNPSIAAGAVGTAEIATNAVGSDELADNAVDTNAIANNAVTAAKVAADVATQAELDAVAALVEWDGFVRKAADESVTSSTTLQDDNELLFAVTANQPYYYKLMLRFQAGGTGDIKHAFALSAGAIVASSAWRQHVGLGPTTGVIQAGQVADIATVIVNAGATSPVSVVQVFGAVTSDSNGNFVFQWAQNASDGTATIVKAGSYLAYRALD